MFSLAHRVSQKRFAIAAFSMLTYQANIEKPVILFCNHTKTATLLEYMLRLLGHRVTALHSGLKQSERVANLARFRARGSRILVATDVAARGLDIPEVALVINYDIPRDPYVIPEYKCVCPSRNSFPTSPSSSLLYTLHQANFFPQR